MALGATHWNVDSDVRDAARRLLVVAPGSWNTYDGHGLPPAHGERRTIDLWAPGGRGDPLPERHGDAMCSWALGQHVIRPIEILIWYGWVWLPSTGWRPYSGFQGTHGPGKDSHIHIGYR